MKNESADFPDVKDHLTIRQAAKALGVSYATANRRVANGTLKATFIGGIYLIPREEIKNFRPRMAGRPRKSVPKWRVSSKDNEQIATSIEGELRAGIGEKEFRRALGKVQRDERLLFSGTIARYVLSGEREPRRVQFLLIWRQTAMPPQEKVEETLNVLRETLSSVLDWGKTRTETLRVWMHT